MHRYELLQVELIIFRDILEEAGEAASLLVLRVEQADHVWLPDEHLAAPRLLLERRQQVRQAHPIASPFELIEALFKLLQI